MIWINICGLKDISVSGTPTNLTAHLSNTHSELSLSEARGSDNVSQISLLFSMMGQKCKKKEEFKFCSVFLHNIYRVIKGGSCYYRSSFFLPLPMKVCLHPCSSDRKARLHTHSKHFMKN